MPVKVFDSSSNFPYSATLCPVIRRSAFFRLARRRRAEEDKKKPSLGFSHLTRCVRFLSPPPPLVLVRRIDFPIKYCPFPSRTVIPFIFTFVFFTSIPFLFCFLWLSPLPVIVCQGSQVDVRLFGLEHRRSVVHEGTLRFGAQWPGELSETIPRQMWLQQVSHCLKWVGQWAADREGQSDRHRLSRFATSDGIDTDYSFCVQGHFCNQRWMVSLLREGRSAVRGHEEAFQTRSSGSIQAFVRRWRILSADSMSHGRRHVLVCRQARRRTERVSYSWKTRLRYVPFSRPSGYRCALVGFRLVSDNALLEIVSLWTPTEGILSKNGLMKDVLTNENDEDDSENRLDDSDELEGSGDY